jgi:two-component system NtrC family sensor kinase
MIFASNEGDAGLSAGSEWGKTGGMRGTLHGGATAVLDAISAHVAVLDPAGIIVAFNEAWLRFAAQQGGDPERCGVGVNYIAVAEASAGCGDVIAGQAAQGIRAVLRGDLPLFSLEYPCHSPDQQRWFLLQASPLAHGQGAVLTHFDITGRRLAEEANARLATILAATSDFVGIANVSGEMIYANAALLALAADSPGGRMPEHLAAFQPAWARRKVVEEGLPAATRDGLWSGETAVLDGEGRELPVNQILIAHRNEAGDLAYFSTIMRDISQMRRREEELRQAYEELKRTQTLVLQNEKLASVGQLAAGVAHEINNPIGYVSSNLGHLRHYFDDLITLLAAFEGAEPHIASEDVRSRLDGLKRDLDLEFLRQDLPNLLGESLDGIDRVRKIVQDLRDFSRSGEHDSWEWYDLRHGLERTLNIIGSELKYKATVQREFADIPEILCLPGQLNQVFMNLLSNAAHAIESNGTVTVRTWGEPEWAWVEIADTGCGIAPEQIDRIFEPFFTTKPVGKGTGLGLSISYGIVRKHGGKIEVDSTLGEGARFRVALPVAGPPGAADAMQT